MPVINIDCRVGFSLFPDNSIDAIVTDPPYELGFMSKSWDSTGIANDVSTWREALRVLKPGGHLLAFSGSRAYHRMTCAIEDAGFEIRDQIMWVYGSGFPKSLNVGDGRGTALKPAHEPIVMARKPLIGTVLTTLGQFGTGAINIDACRVETNDTWGQTPRKGAPGVVFGSALNSQASPSNELGRWPANFIHDGSDEVLEAFPVAPGQIAAESRSDTPKSSIVYAARKRGDGPTASENSSQSGVRRTDSGSAARFFYCAKASKADRDEGLENFNRGACGDGRTVAADNAYQRGVTLRANVHSTVKPNTLMRYLCRLITPPGGTIIDPFAGSGSTGKAAKQEGFDFYGFELSAEYCAIANARIDAA